MQGSYGWGMQPRSALGQTKDGEVLLLVVDGRQMGYSLGCTVSDCADILLRHKAYQANNLDGGSSAIMDSAVPHWPAPVSVVTPFSPCRLA